MRQGDCGVECGQGEHQSDTGVLISHLAAPFGSLVANKAASKNTVCKYMRVLISGFFVAKRCFKEESQPHFQRVSHPRACVYVCITCKERCKKGLICKKHLKVGFINRER